jgi:hypothetical protein
VLALTLALPATASGQLIAPRNSPSLLLRPTAANAPIRLAAYRDAFAADSVKKKYNWGAGFIGAGIGAAVGVGAGLLIHSLQDTGEEGPEELVALGALGAIVGFFVGLGLGNR